MGRFILVALLCAVASSLPAADKPVITVLDLKTDGVSEKEMRSIVSLLSSALFQTGRFKVIDTTQRDVLLKEVAFSTADCTDESCQLQIGKLLAAEMIVVGTVGKLGSRYLLSTKMLLTESAETLSVADGVYATLDALVDSLPGIAGKLAGSSAAVSRPRSAARGVFAVGSLVAGLGSAGMGGWLLYDGAVRGKAAIELANANYDSAGAAEAPSLWDTLVSVTDAAKRTVLWGIGVASAGVLLTGIGGLLAIPAGSPSTPAPAVSMLVRPDVVGLTMGLSIALPGGAR